MTDAELQEALAVAYRYVNRRERTVGETRLHLASKGVDPTVVDGALDVLTEGGYLDDERFARVFAQDKRTLEQWGTDRIRRGLIGHHVDAELVEKALAGADTEGEMDRALDLLGRRCPEPARDRRARDRALGILLRKGYDPDLALEALRVHNRLVAEGTTTRRGLAY